MAADLEEKILESSLLALQKGKTILYPTDTVWGLGCDATNVEAVKKIYKIKKREESKSLIVLVDSIEMLKKYIKNVPEKALNIIKQSKKPTTIIYNNPVGIAENIINKVDNTIAIRIIKNLFCEKMIKDFGKPIVSTSANISGAPTPKSFFEISKSILTSVDYVVDLHTEKISTKSSIILKVDNEDIIVIRE